MKTQITMNLRFLTYFMICALSTSLDFGSLHAQTASWLTGFGNATRNDQVSKMTNDPWGNVYVHGVFRDNTNFINLSLNSTTDKGFIGRLQANGNFAWVSEIDSIRSANAMAADGFGNIYLAGYGIDFTYKRQILVQLDSSGNYLSSTRIEGCEIYDVVVDHNGDIFLTGNMANHLIVGGDTVLTNPVPSSNNVIVAGFILKYDPVNQTSLWGEVAYTDAGAMGYVSGSRLAVDGSGNVFMTGNYRSDSLRLGGSATGFMLLPQTWQANQYLARFDATGNIQWVRTGVMASFGEIVANANGELYCSGNAQGYNNGTVYFMDTTYNITNNFVQSFVAKIDANGQRIGFHNEPASSTNYPSSIVLSTAGEPIIGNQFSGDITIMGTLLASGNMQSSYVQKFSTDLTPQWVKFCQGVNVSPFSLMGNQLNGLAIDLYGNYYFGGGYQGQTMLDNLTINSLSTDPNDSLDSWVGLIVDQAFSLPTDSVWPGDTDYDGIANNFDLLPIGLAYGTVGLNRPNASIVWQGQPSPNWFQSLPGGINYKHIDTDGDGIIGDNDTLAITQNYGFMHQRGDETSGTGPMIYLEFTEDTIYAGDTATLLINLGMDTLPANNIYGLGFTINYDSSLVDPNSFHVDYSQSWLGTTGTNLLKLDKNFPNNEQLDMALTRIDQQNQNGFGELARIRLIMVDDLTAKADLAESLALDIANIYAISADGSVVDLVSQGDSVIVFQEDTTSSTNIQPDWYQQVQLYPNPTQDQIQISLAAMTAQSLLLYDLQGRLVHQEDKAFRQTQLSLNHLAAGVYVLRLQTDKGWYQQRVMKK